MKHAAVAAVIVALALLSPACAAYHAYRDHRVTQGQFVADLGLFAGGVAMQIHAHQPTPEDPARGNFGAEDITGITLTVGTFVVDSIAMCLWAHE